MLVLVTDVDEPSGSVTTATATRQDGATVIFAGDTRMMAGLAEIVEDEGECPAEIEPWMILSVDTSTRLDQEG